MKQQGSEVIQFIDATRNVEQLQTKSYKGLQNWVAPFQKAANRPETDPRLYLKDLVLDRTRNETPMLY